MERIKDVPPSQKVTVRKRKGILVSPPAPQVDLVALSERLTRVEQTLKHIEDNFGKLESSIEKVLVAVDKREQVFVKEIDQLEEQVDRLQQKLHTMENRMAFWHGIVALIAFLWPAFLKFWPF